MMETEKTLTLLNESKNTLAADEKCVETLIDGFISGEREDTEELFKYYYRQIYLNCCRVMGNDSAAEDLTHETFVRVLKYKNTYDRKQNFLFWILKISLNVCIYHFYRQNIRNKSTISIEELESDNFNYKKLHEILTDKNAEAMMDKSLEKEIIGEAVNLLPNIYKIPVILKYYYDFSYEEVATILEKPIGTIKFRFNKAKKILARYLTYLKEENN